MKKFLKDLFYRPATKSISISRVVFMLVILISLYTTITKNEVLTAWAGMALALLPYMYLDKKIETVASTPATETEDTSVG